MAEDIKKVVKVEVGDSQVTIKSLRQEMSELRDTILNLDSSSEEYAKAVEQLQSRQEKLNNVMKLSKKASGESDNALKQLREQIKQYRNDVLNAEEGTEEWTKAMQNLSNASFQLRDMNEQARYSVDDLGEQLANVNTIATGVVGGFNALQGAVVLFGGESENLEKVMVRLQAGIAIVQGMQGLEGMKDSLVGLSNVINSSVLPSLKNFAKSIGKGGWVAIIVAVITTIISLIGYFKSLSSQQKFYTKIVDDSTRAVREFNNALEDEEKQLSRNERIMKALGKSEEEILKNRLRTLTLLKEKAYWEFSSALSQLSLLEPDTEFYNKQKQLVDELEKQFITLGDRVIDTKNELRALAIEAQRATQETAKTTAEILANPPESTLTGDEVKFDDGIEKIPDTKLDTSSSNGVADNARNLISAKELTLRKELNKAILLDEEERYKKEYELRENFNKEKLNLINQAILDETNMDKVAPLLAEKAELEIEIERNKNEELARLRKEDQQSRLASIQQAVQGVSSLMGSLADIYESGDEISEEEAKKAKQLRIAQATIDTLYGSVTAYMTTLKAFPAPINIPLAVLNAGTVLASGMATIAKIKAQDPTKGGGSGMGASVTPMQTFSTAMPMTAENQATNLQNIESINANSQVYILESDIQDSNKRVEIREEETTF